MIKYYLGIGVVTLMVVAAIIYGFTGSGSPASVRAAKFDALRLQNLNDLKYTVESYYRTNSELPLTLDQASQGGGIGLKDPETGKSYEYIPGNGVNYQLCAVFSASNLNSATKQRSVYDYYGGNSNSLHGKGRKCFDYTVTPNYRNAYPNYNLAPTSLPTPTLFVPPVTGIASPTPFPQVNFAQ